MAASNIETPVNVVDNLIAVNKLLNRYTFDQQKPKRKPTIGVEHYDQIPQRLEHPHQHSALVKHCKQYAIKRSLALLPKKAEVPPKPILPPTQTPDKTKNPGWRPKRS